MNFTASLSFHEANIITHSMLKLKEIDVPAYSMHDGLIVKRSNVDTSISTLREVYAEYVSSIQRSKKLSTIGILVPVSVEGLDTDKCRYSGNYWT